MITVKLSFSILNAWANNRWEDAVAMYLGKGIVETPELQLGKLKHEIWADEVMNTKCLPKDFGGKKLSDPIVEQKYEYIVPFSDDIQILLRGVPDTMDGEIIYEYKCGATQASQYVDSMQVPYYLLFNPHAKEGHYLCFNPYTNDYSIGVKFLDGKTIDNVLEHIISNGGELIDYLQSQKLLKDYKEV